MAREKNEKRVKALEIFLENDGDIKNTEIAKMLEVDSGTVRKWKCLDKWNEELEKKPKKRGGQKGNQNAKGHGAPLNNRNAETHGAYSRVNFDNFSEEEKAFIENISLDTQTNLLYELQNLIAKELDLRKRIAEYQQATQGELYTDKVVEMRTPAKEGEDSDPYGNYDDLDLDPTGAKKNNLNIAMETTIKSSAFERQMKLEAELNKTHGRIIKLLDSIKSYELEQRRIEIEEKRYTLQKQKASGVYEVDPDTGDIDDTYTGIDIEDEGVDGLED